MDEYVFLSAGKQKAITSRLGWCEEVNVVGL